MKHSAASDIRITFAEQGGCYVMSIRDNGCGINLDGLDAKSMGLRTMTYRAESMGGSLSVTRPSDGGTEITCTVPSQPHREA